MKKINNLKVNNAILFCGGKGSRLGLIGKKKNKSLILVKNKPIIFYIISQLLKSNVDQIIFPLGYKGRDIKDYVKKNFPKNISNFLFINTGVNSEISERLLKIKKYLPSEGSTILVNGDTIFDFKLQNFFNSHYKSKKKISLATFNTKIDLGFIVMNKKKPKKFEKSLFVSNFGTQKLKFFAYSGFVIINTKILKDFRFKLKKDFEIEMYNYYLKSADVNVFRISNGTCFPIDNVKNLTYANKNIILKN